MLNILQAFTGLTQIPIFLSSNSSRKRPRLLNHLLGLLGRSHCSLLRLDQFSQFLVSLHTVLLGPVGHRFGDTVPPLRSRGWKRFQGLKIYHKQLNQVSEYLLSQPVPKVSVRLGSKENC